MNKKLVALIALISCTSTVVSAVSYQFFAGIGAGAVALAGTYYASGREVVKMSVQGNSALAFELSSRKGLRGTTTIERFTIDLGSKEFREEALKVEPKRFVAFLKSKSPKFNQKTWLFEPNMITKADIEKLQKKRWWFC